MKKEAVLGIVSIFALVLIFGCVGSSSNNGPVSSIQNTVVGFTFPKTDVQGKDISDIPRYPGSIRMSYEEDEGDYYIDYYISGNKASEVSSFYSDKMPQYGWEKTETSNQGGSMEFKVPGMGSVSSSNSIEYSYQKDNDNYESSVAIGVVTINNQKYTMIEITYYNYTNLSGEESYNSVNEVSVPDKASSYNNLIKPLLANEFGGAKVTKAEVTTFHGVSDITLDYFLKEKVNSSNQVVSALNSLKTNGYNLTNSDVGSDYYDYTFMKGTQTSGSTIEAKGNIGDNYIEFLVTEYSLG